MTNVLLNYNHVKDKPCELCLVKLLLELLISGIADDHVIYLYVCKVLVIMLVIKKYMSSIVIVFYSSYLTQSGQHNTLQIQTNCQAYSTFSRATSPNADSTPDEVGPIH